MTQQVSINANIVYVPSFMIHNNTQARRTNLDILKKLVDLDTLGTVFDANDIYRYIIMNQGLIEIGGKTVKPLFDGFKATLLETNYYNENLDEIEKYKKALRLEQFKEARTVNDVAPMNVLNNYFRVSDLMNVSDAVFDRESRTLFLVCEHDDVAMTVVSDQARADEAYVKVIDQITTKLGAYSSYDALASTNVFKEMVQMRWIDATDEHND